MTDPDGTHALSHAIFVALVNAQYAIDPLFRSHSRWRMNADWLEVLKQMRDRSGVELSGPATHLLGWPIEVTADGGAPHVVWNDE